MRHLVYCLSYDMGIKPNQKNPKKKKKKKEKNLLSITARAKSTRKTRTP
jgi:hypothetical protein